MPYITDYQTPKQISDALDQGKALSLDHCAFCSKEIFVPSSRLNQDCFCSEDHFRARYGALEAL